MIEASFGRTGRGATVDGAYQYDTGQRLRMRGLPSPDEFSERDDFLAGDTVTVQAQYSFMGDRQTEARLAQWDDMESAWVAEIPDTYLLRSADVHVYIYVSYGSAEDEVRSKTCYEAVFRPISRPAPSNSVTPGQLNAWDALVQEVNLAISGAYKAESDANSAKVSANEAADKANKSAAKIDNMTVEAKTLEAGSDATVSISEKDGKKHIVIGVPVGADGKPGVAKINGIEVTDEGEINLTAKDVGALPDTHQTVFEFTATIPSVYWAGDPPYRQTIQIAGIKETDSPIVDVILSAPEEMAELLESYAAISNIYTGEGEITVSCLMEKPLVSIPIRLLCVR